MRGGAVLTPPLRAGILEGVTRGIVLRLARDLGVPAREEPIRAADLQAAEELFLTSSAREVLPVTRLGERPVGSGRPGSVTSRLHAAYRARADRLSAP